MTRRARGIVWAAALAAFLCSTALGVTRATASEVARQTIAIEERSTAGSAKGTFKLIPLTPGSVKADAGTVTFSVQARPTVVVNGQRVTTYVNDEVLKGKRGVLTIRSVMRSTDGGGGFLVGTGTWSVTTGTKAYKTLKARGGASGVVTSLKAISTRYEGYVATP